MRIVVDSRISLQAVQRGKPTVSSGRKAAVPDALWRVPRTPAGSESRAWLQRGNSGTWESHLFPSKTPRLGDRVSNGPGVPLQSEIKFSPRPADKPAIS